MPRPISTPPAASRRQLRELRVTVSKAKPETTIAISIEAMVIPMSYAIGTGRLKASMPMKCIDQMPIPMANAPPRSQDTAAAPVDAVMREARSSAVYEARAATRNESRTSQWL